MFAQAHSPHPARSRHGVHAYAQVGIETGVTGASPHQLVQMLFDGLLESITKARGAVQSADIEARGRAISRAVAIVNEGLQHSLDLSHGGELAQNLNDLYAYVVTRLVQANARNDAEALAECQRLIQPLRDAWASIADRVPGQG